VRPYRVGLGRDDLPVVRVCPESLMSLPCNKPENDLEGHRALRKPALGVLSACFVKRVLRILAVVVVLGAVGLWAVKGANRGWTQTKIKHDIPDPVTGLSGVAYENGFIPGVDFLFAAALAAAGLAGISLLIKNKNTSK
jgi:hypothetical protein